MNPRPHHQSVQDNYAAVEDTRYLEEEQGRVETFTESLDHVAAVHAAGHLLDVGCHVGTFLTIAEQAGFQVAGVEPSRWASEIARGAHLRPGAPRRRRGRPAAGGRLRRDHALGRDRAPARSRRSTFARSTPRCGPAACSRSRRWTSTRCSRACSAAAGRGTCRCTSCTSRAARCARCCGARASTSWTSALHTPPRADVVPRLAPRRLRAAARAAARRRPGAHRLAERTVGIKLGDIFTVIARKPTTA